NAYPVKDLEDPKGAMGDPEKLHFTATKGFSDEFSDAAEYVGNIKLNDEQYGDLEDLVVNEYEDDGEKAITEWLKANPDAYEGEAPESDGSPRRGSARAEEDTVSPPLRRAAMKMPVPSRLGRVGRAQVCEQTRMASRRGDRPRRFDLHPGRHRR